MAKCNSAELYCPVTALIVWVMKNLNIDSNKYFVWVTKNFNSDSTTVNIQILCNLNKISDPLYIYITKTYLYNFDPLKPHFYIVKLGFTGVYIIFLISAQNIDCGYSLELHRWGSSNEYPQSMFWTEIWKISEFFIWKFSDFGGEIFYM